MRYCLLIRNNICRTLPGGAFFTPYGLKMCAKLLKKTNNLPIFLLYAPYLQINPKNRTILYRRLMTTAKYPDC